MRKISNILYCITGAINVCLIILIISLTFLQVITRYVISFSIPWAQELTVFTMVWMVLLGCSMGMRRHEVASLTLFVEKLPYRGQQIMNIINQSVLIAFFVIIIKSNHTVILNSMARLSGMMHMPMGYVNLPLSIMSALIIFYGLIDIYDSILNIVKHGKEEKSA